MKSFANLLFILFLAVYSSFAQGNSEIFLFSIQAKEGKTVLVDGKNITNNPGYDNQPSFSLGNKSILFTSIRGGENSDIFEYVIADGKINQITNSKDDGEYSPRELDEDTITFVREGKGQEMTVWKFDRKTKNESTALKIKEPIGYYVWNYKGDALVWVRYAFMIHWVNGEKSINKFVADYAQPSIPQLIPGTSEFSFMERLPNDELWIKGFDPETQAVKPIAQPKDGKKDYCWLNESVLLIGSGSKLYRFDVKAGKTWELLADLDNFGIKDITRMAVSFDGKSLALVSNQ